LHLEFLQAVVEEVIVAAALFEEVLDRLAQPLRRLQVLDNVELLADAFGERRKLRLQRFDGVRVRCEVATSERARSKVDVADEIGQALRDGHFARHQLEQGHRRLRRVAADRHRYHRDAGLLLLESRRHNLVRLGLRSDRRLGDLLASRAEIEPGVNDAVERGELFVERRVEVSQLLDRLLTALKGRQEIKPLQHLVLAMLKQDELLLALFLGLGGEEGRRARGQGLGLGLQFERRDDFRNIAMGNAVEQITDLLEQEPGGDTADDRGAGDGAKREEQPGLDTELGMLRHCQSPGLVRGHLKLLHERATPETSVSPSIASSPDGRELRTVS
jgi:hypothetical protein